MRLNLAGRQWPLYVYHRVDFNELNAVEDGDFGILVLPPGAFLLADLHLIVEEAVVGTTTASVTVTNDANAGAVVGPVDLMGAPATTVVTVAGFYPEGFRLRFTVNKTGAAATAGVARVIGSYVIEHRATETADDGRAP